MKLRWQYYTAIIISLNIITYFFGVVFGYFAINFYGFLAVTIQEILIQNIIKKNLPSITDEHYRDFLLSLKAPVYMLLISFMIPLALSLNIFTANFNIAENSLLKVDGVTVASTTNNNGSNADYYVDINTNQKNQIKLVFNYMLNRVEYRKVAIPDNEHVKALYTIGQPRGSGTYANLAYDIRSKDKIYLDYKEQKEFYINFQKKAIKHLVLSTVLNVSSIFTLFLVLIHRIRS